MVNSALLIVGLRVVGDLVGCDVGMWVGLVVGAVEGADDGVNDGELDGVSVGVVVGCKVALHTCGFLSCLQFPTHSYPLAQPQTHVPSSDMHIEPSPP